MKMGLWTQLQDTAPVFARNPKGLVNILVVVENNAVPFQSAVPHTGNLDISTLFGCIDLSGGINPNGCSPSSGSPSLRTSRKKVMEISQPGNCTRAGTCNQEDGRDGPQISTDGGQVLRPMGAVVPPSCLQCGLLRCPPCAQQCPRDLQHLALQNQLGAPPDSIIVVAVVRVHVAAIREVVHGQVCPQAQHVS